MSSFTYDEKKFFKALDDITRCYKEGLVTNNVAPNFLAAQPSLDYVSGVVYAYYNGLKVSGAVQQALGEHTSYWALEVAKEWNPIKDQAQSSGSAVIVDGVTLDRWIRTMQEAERRAEVEIKGDTRKRKADEMIQMDDGAGVGPNGTGDTERQPQKKKQPADGGNESASKKDPTGLSETTAASNASSSTKGHKSPAPRPIQDGKKGKSKGPSTPAVVSGDDSEHDDADGSDSATEEEPKGKGRQARNRKTQPKADHKRQYCISEDINDPPCETCRRCKVDCNRVKTGGGSCYPCAKGGKPCEFALSKKEAGRQGAANRLHKSEPADGVVPKPKRASTIAALEKRIAALEQSLRKSEAAQSELQDEFYELQDRMDVLEHDSYYNAHLLGITARDYRTTTIAQTVAIYQAARDATFAVQQARVLTAAADQPFVPYPTTIKSCARYKHTDPPIVRINGGEKTYGGDRPTQYITRLVRFPRSNSAEHQLERDVEEEFVPDPEDYSVSSFVDIADEDRRYKVAPVHKVASKAEGSIFPPFQPVKVSTCDVRSFRNNDTSTPTDPHSPRNTPPEDDMDVDIGEVDLPGSRHKLYRIPEGEEGWEMTGDDLGKPYGLWAVGGLETGAREKGKDAASPAAVEEEQARAASQVGDEKEAAGCSDGKVTSAGASGEGGNQQASSSHRVDHKVQEKAPAGGQVYKQVQASGQKYKEEEAAAASDRQENMKALTEDSADPEEAAVAPAEQAVRQQQEASTHKEAVTVEHNGTKLSPPKTAAAHPHKPQLGFDTDEPLTTPDQSESEMEADESADAKPGPGSGKSAATTRSLRPRPAKPSEQKPADKKPQATQGKRGRHRRKASRKGPS